LFKSSDFLLRPANSADAAALAALSFRSKAHWGYDAAFMEQVRNALEPELDYLANSPVFVLERGGEAVAFYGFKMIDGEIFLHDFFIVPELIGQGIGKQLWLCALDTARAENYTSFLIESDPFAKGFYSHMGARQIGQISASGTGRLLPLLRFDIIS
jgi:GNAT superfamily N-acetyltransferase